MALALVYVFAVATCAVLVKGGWNDFPTMLRPAVVGNEMHFGVTLALDDDYLVVGTNMDDETVSKTNVGSVTIFAKATGPWDKMGDKIVPATDTSVAGDKFGSDVNIHDGVVIIGDRKDNIAIYKTDGTTWSEDERKDETTDSTCGYSVEIYAPYVAYGCPDDNQVKIYKLENAEYFASNTKWILPLDSQPDSGVSFGDELSMYGNRLAVSSSDNVYIYITDGVDWTLEGTIAKSPLLRKDGAFGRAISLYDDRLVIASLDTNSKATIYIYEKATDWPAAESPTAQFTPETNSAGYAGVSVSLYDDYIVAGFYGHANSPGSVKIYNKLTTWGEYTNLESNDPVHGDMYGRSVAAWRDNFVAGAPLDDDDDETVDTNGGAVYVFDKSTGWTTVLIDGAFSLSMTMELYGTDQFTTPVTGPLVINNYDDYIYVGIKETNANSFFIFIVNNCWATPSTNPSDSTRYELYEDKCITDSTFTIESNTNNDHFNFKFNAFEFITSTESSIYVHCQIHICKSDDGTCTQTCPGRRRRSAIDKSNILADFVLASSEIILVHPSCSNITCPSNSKCFDVGRATCVCDADYVYSMLTKTCTNARILRINGIHLDVPWLDTYANESSTDLTRVSVEKERTLFTVIKKREADDVIDGLRLVNARKKSSGVVFDVMVSHTSRATRKTAYSTFMSCIKSAVQDRREEERRKFLKKKRTKRKKMLENWMMTLVIVCVICAALFIIPLSLYVTRRLRIVDRKEEGVPTKENEIGTENDGADKCEEAEKTVA